MCCFETRNIFFFHLYLKQDKLLFEKKFEQTVKGFQIMMIFKRTFLNKLIIICLSIFKSFLLFY